jgi:WhiB family transcriptional regulator, redox-sensing transcriptional regulator
VIPEPAIDSTWKTDAACRDEDQDLFFPGSDIYVDPIAVAICGACPVCEECLEYSLVNNEEYGIWAGTSPYQRRRIKSMRRRGGDRW